MTVSNNSLFFVIHQIANRLHAVCSSQHEAEQEAWILIEKITNKSKSMHFVAKNIDLSPQQQDQLNIFLDQRINQHKPLHYIVGNLPFCGLDIIVRPPILIPRPETEELVTWLIDKLEPVKHEKLTILDLCTGSGCIALALAQALPQSNVVGVDINKDALALAAENKLHNALTNVAFVYSDLYKSLHQTLHYDLIVSNPPYVTFNEYETLQPEVRLWEDKDALVAGQEGLDFYEQIACGARTYLNPYSVLIQKNLPRLVVELGNNAPAVEAILTNHAFVGSQVHHDLQGKRRWLAASFS
jgi:release factor glutamine methyltransferase